MTDYNVFPKETFFILCLYNTTLFCKLNNKLIDDLFAMAFSGDLSHNFNTNMVQMDGYIFDTQTKNSISEGRFYKAFVRLLTRTLVVDASPEGSFKATLQKVWSRIFTIGFLIEWSLPTTIGLSFNLYLVENLLKNLQK